MAFTEDLTEFLDTTHGFAVAATYNGTTTVNGIFDDEYFEVGIGTPGVEGSQPSFICRAADVSAAVQGDTLLIGSTTYTVVNVQPDGTGMIRLVLRE